MRNNLIILFTIFLFSIISTEAYSQRRSSRTSERTSNRTSSRGQDDTETISFKEKLAFDIHIGNIGLNNGFSFSGKGGVGYKITDRFTTGVGVKWFYQFVNINQQQFTQPDFSLFHYGAYIYPRFKITEEIYLKGEYNFFSYQGDPLSNSDRFNIDFPLLGGGYMSGFGKWKYGFEVLFALSNEGRDQYTTIEYMISFLYNL